MLFGNERPELSSDSAIKLLNGASAPLIVAPQVVEVANLTLQTAPTTGSKYTIYITPPAATSLMPAFGVSHRVVGVQAVWAAASSSGTIQVEKCPSGTANGSGTNLLSATIDGSTTADTATAGTLVTNLSSLTLAAGDKINVVFGGTTTSWASLGIVVYIARIPNSVR